MIAASLTTAYRSLRRFPAFFVISTLSLGIALGFSTTAISLIDGIRNPVNPYIEPDRTYYLQHWGAGNPVHPGATADEVRTALRAVPAFDALTEFGIHIAQLEGTLDNQPRDIAIVQQNFFDLIRVRPQIGRLFTAADFAAGDVIVVSDDLWHELFKSKSIINGEHIQLAGRSYSIIGVLPPHAQFAGPFGADAWRPETADDRQLTLTPSGKTTNYVMRAGGFFAAHLKPGVTATTAAAQLTGLAARLTTTYNTGDRPYGFTMHPLTIVPGQIEFFQLLLAFIGLCMLFISCANIATLMLARAAARRRELALRLSLGASIKRLVASQFAEIAVIAAAGGVTGLVVSFWGIAAAAHAVPAEMRSLQQFDPHWSWRFFTITLCAVAAVVIGTGLLPALQVTRVQPMEPLKDGSGNTTAKASQGLKFVVVVQVAVTLALLFGATLLTRSSSNLAAAQLGFDPRPIVTVHGNFMYRQNININHFDDAATGMLPRVLAIPGVVSATTVATEIPLSNVVYADETLGRGLAPLNIPQYAVIGAHYFRTMGIPLLEGHDVDDGDAGTGVVILDERAAKVLFPNGHAIGHTVKFGPPESAAPWLRIIGISRAASMSPRDAIDGPQWLPVYASVPHQDERQWKIVARVTGDVNAVQFRMDRELNASLPFNARAFVTAMGADLARNLRALWYFSDLFAALGALALAASAAGLFAVIAYIVTQRMREFGVRVALGAQRRHVFRLVIKDAAEIVLGGTALGAFAGFVAATMIEGALIGVTPTDAVSLVAAESILITVAFAACLAPAMRATRANPLDVIRAT